MRKKILIIDDEVEIVETIQYRLEAEGFEVICAYDGFTGLTMARTSAPDLIILDVLMPKMDGFNTCRMIKFDMKHEHIPIIILTGRCEEKDMKTIEEIKADVFMKKPFEGQELLAQIKRLLALA